MHPEVTFIAPEQFVRPLTDKGDFDILPGSLRHKIHWNDRRGGNGFLQTFHDLRHRALKLNHVEHHCHVPGTKNSNYIDLSATFELGSGWGVNGHVGRLDLKDVNDGSYTDWKLGLTKDLSGWVLGAAYVDTNAKGDCPSQFYCFFNSSGSKTKDAGKSTVVFSVSKTF